MKTLLYWLRYPHFAFSWWIAGVPFSLWKTLRSRRWGWATAAEIEEARRDPSVRERMILVGEALHEKG